MTVSKQLGTIQFTAALRVRTRSVPSADWAPLMTTVQHDYPKSSLRNSSSTPMP